MPLPEYRYGKVIGTFPDLTIVSERGETPMVCCGYCSAHMAALTSKPGLTQRMVKEAHEIREAGGRAHNAGSKASELRAGADKALGVHFLSVAVADIPDRLRKGFAVVASVQYAKLPDYLRIQVNDFGHSICLFGWDDPDSRGGVFDPLWDQGARGAWSPWAHIQPALWGDGNHLTTTVRVMPMAGDYVIFDEQVQSLKTGQVAASTPFFNDWTMNSKRGSVGAAPIKCQMMGYRGDAYAIQVKTGQGWSDGVSRVTLVFVDKDRVSDIRDAEPPKPPAPAGCSEEELLAAEQRGYDLALSVFPPRPI